MESESDGPIVSVIIPFYNAGAYLRDAVNSVQVQTLSRFECILVDDGSTDLSWAIAEEYAASDPRIKIYKRPGDRPKGAGTCRNYGIEKAQGEFSVFLDADDWLAEFCMEQRIAAFRQFPHCDFLVFTAKAIKLDPDRNIIFERIFNNDDGVRHKKDYLKKFLRYELPWNMTCPIWKTSFLRQTGGFDESFQRMQDPELHTRVLLMDGVRFERITDKPADSFYRMGGAGKYASPELRRIILDSFYRYFAKFSNAIQSMGRDDLVQDLKCFFKIAARRVFSYRESLTELQKYLPMLREARMFNRLEVFLLKVLIGLESFRKTPLPGGFVRLAQRVVFKLLAI
jgi:glycosyltransferase involved in cell wall biosynthesis